MSCDPRHDRYIAKLPAAPDMHPLDDAGLSLWAPAKINLNLMVGALGSDGFHPIDSIVAKVTLYDSMELRRRSDGRVVLDCTGADCGPPEKNLVTRAAKLLSGGRDVCGADIKLSKAIPPGAGLGGGSSDAAAALRGLNELWGLGYDQAALSELAAQLGSEVSLFLGPPAARMTGRGECVEPLDVCDLTAVLVLSELVCSTVEVYGAYDRLGAAESEQLDTSLLSTGPPSGWRDRLHNDLANAAMDVCPELPVLRDRIRGGVDAPVHVTGSGSALFMLFDDSDQAANAVAGFDLDLQNMCAIVGLNPW